MSPVRHVKVINNVACAKCGRLLSLSGNELGIVMPFRENDTVRWGIYCASERCYRLPGGLTVGEMQNNRFKQREGRK